MVCTRSGKSTSIDVVVIPTKRNQGRKAKAAVVVEDSTNHHQQVVQKSQEKKRESPVKADESPAKKPKVVDSLPLSSDSSNIVSNNLIDVKKIGISADEKMMNGAPEGDLYDVVLLEDSQLPAFETSIQALDELVKNLQHYNETSVWAEKYESITIFRRIILHHALILTNPSHQSLLTCLIDGIQSLRSSNVRNSLLCIKQYSKLIFGENNVEGIWSFDSFATLVTVLLNRLGSGPKFLCEATMEALKVVFEHCPAEYSIGLLSNFVNHRNLDTSWKSIQLLTLIFKQIPQESWERFLQSVTNPSDDKEDRPWMKTCLTLLSLSLSAKKPQGKELAKETWQILQSLLGPESFSKLIDQTLSSSQFSEIHRELLKSASASSKGMDLKAGRLPFKETISATAAKRIPIAAMKSSFAGRNAVTVEDSMKSSVLMVCDTFSNENDENQRNQLVANEPQQVMKKPLNRQNKLSNQESMTSIQKPAMSTATVPYDFML